MKMTTAAQLLMQAAAAAAGSAVSAGKRLNRRLRRGKNVQRLRRATLTMTRTTAPFSISLVAGVGSGVYAPTLGACQTSDLIAMYDEYKINWMEFILIPRYDPGQSGVTNNSDVFVVAACDVTGALSAPTFTQLSAFDNSKVAPLQAGKSFRYRFVPRAINTLASGNYAVNQSDWIILNASGVNVPHNQLGFVIQTPLATNVLAYDYIVRINFSVKQAS